MSKKTRPESAVYPKHFKPWDLEPYYSIHVSAMTTEQLHDKADIAEQLAWRDREIARLRDEIGKLVYLSPEQEPQGAPGVHVDPTGGGKVVITNRAQGAPPRQANSLDDVRCCRLPRGHGGDCDFIDSPYGD